LLDHLPQATTQQPAARVKAETMIPESKLANVFHERRHRRNVRVLVKYTLFVASDSLTEP
jgi:hypothetical protein